MSLIFCKKQYFVFILIICLSCSLNWLSAQTPNKNYSEILNNIQANKQEFYAELKSLLDSETDNLFILVDKKHYLPKNYVPKNLVNLTKFRTYNISRNDLSLTNTAEQALEEMAKKAKADNITLLVSSSYRSYIYQNNLFARYANQYGEQKADTFSARAGTSQHQLGTVVDFGSISDDFAYTKAGKWLKKNACKYGWSLSFPKGYDDITGYKWECWHFRYIGVDACNFQNKWFDGIQQYMLEFIHNWKKNNSINTTN